MNQVDKILKVHQGSISNEILAPVREIANISKTLIEQVKNNDKKPANETTTATLRHEDDYSHHTSLSDLGEVERY